MFFKLTFIIFLISQPLFSTSGVSIRIRQEVIDALIIALKPKILAQVLQIRIDDFQVSVLGFGCVFGNLQILNLEFVDEPKSSTLNSEICLKTARAKIRGTVYMKCSSFLMNPEGAIDFFTEITDVNVCLEITIDEQHQLIGASKHLQVEMPTLQLVLNNTHNTYLGSITHGIINALIPIAKIFVNKFFKNNLEKEVNKSLEQILKKYPPLIVIDAKSRILFDLTPSYPPIIYDGLFFKTNGYFYQERERINNFDLPNASKEVPVLDSEYGVTLTCDDFILRNFIGVLFDNTKLFSQTFEERSDLIPFDFTIEGFSKIFQNLDKFYQPSDLSTKLKLKITQVPNIKIKNDYISLFLIGEVEAFVIKTDGTEESFALLSVIGNVDFSISLEQISQVKIVPLDSTIIDVDYFELYGVVVDRELLNQTINGAVKIWINYFGFSHKLALNIIQNMVVFQKTEMRLKDNLLVLSADMLFNEFKVDAAADINSNKKNVEKSPAANQSAQKLLINLNQIKKNALSSQKNSNNVKIDKIQSSEKLNSDSKQILENTSSIKQGSDGKITIITPSPERRNSNKKKMEVQLSPKMIKDIESPLHSARFDFGRVIVPSIAGNFDFRNMKSPEKIESDDTQKNLLISPKTIKI